MARCSRCWLDSDATTRIREDVAASCLKNRTSPCSACRKLLKIEGKIEETRRTLEQLLTEREKLASALNDNHDPFLTQLPVEIVSHIFAFSRPYQPSLDTFDCFNEQKNIRGVLTLGHVCLNWRNIANRTPELWSVFGATIMTNNRATSLGMSVEWLGNSGELPLFVRLNVTGLARDYYAPHTTAEVLASIAQHAQRWKVLHLTIHIDLVHFFSAAVSGNHLDRLEHLSLNLDLDGAYDTRPVVVSASPQRLTVESGWLQHIIIDWSKLTHFSGACFTEFSVPECVHLFQCAPNLSTCTIGTIVAAPHTLETLDTLVTNRSLHTLQLGACSTNFWDHFNFPSLRTVRLDEGSDPESWISFVDFLRRSECQITDLHIDEGAETEEYKEGTILDGLKLSPNVERLSITGFNLASRLLSLINNILESGDPVQSNPPLLPKINALIFRSYDSSALFDWSSLVTFVTAYTSKAAQNLWSVDIFFEKQLTFDPPVYLVDRTMLQRLLDIAGGLELRVVDYKGLDLLGRLRRHYGL